MVGRDVRPEQLPLLQQGLNTWCDTHTHTHTHSLPPCTSCRHPVAILATFAADLCWHHVWFDLPLCTSYPRVVQVGRCRVPVVLLRGACERGCGCGTGSTEASRGVRCTHRRDEDRRQGAPSTHTQTHTRTHTGEPLYTCHCVWLPVRFLCAVLRLCLSPHVYRHLCTCACVCVCVCVYLWLTEHTLVEQVHLRALAKNTNSVCVCVSVG